MEGRSRMVDIIKPLIPRPLYAPTKGAYRFLLNLYWAVPLLMFERRLRKNYGQQFKVTIDPCDEMYRYSRDLRKVVPNQARFIYLRGGHRIVEDLECILQDLGYSTSNFSHLLEFASGYGKVTRFLATRIDPSKITVSDIDHRAVDFNTRTFGTKGFYSVADPHDLHPDGVYDLVFVYSLFSHLPAATWGAWLLALYGMLSVPGLLIFTTHGLGLYEAPDTRIRETEIHRVEDGFYFRYENETFGRLDPHQYGTTYVSPEYVQATLERNNLPQLKRVYPLGFGGFQDAYILEHA